MASKYDEALLGPIVASSTTLAEVLRRRGLQPTGGNYRYINGRIRHLRLGTGHFRSSMAQQIGKLTREELAPLVAESSSVAEVLRKLCLPEHGRPHHDLTARLRALGIDTSHYRGSAWSRGETRDSHPSVEKYARKRMLPDDVVFSHNAPPIGGERLLKRLLRKGMP